MGCLPSASAMAQYYCVVTDAYGFTASSETVTIGFAGDILFDTEYAAGNAFKNAGNTAEGVIGQSLLERMRSADIMMVNNEFAYSNGGSPTPDKAPNNHRRN